MEEGVAIWCQKAPGCSTRGHRQTPFGRLPRSRSLRSRDPRCGPRSPPSPLRSLRQPPSPSNRPLSIHPNEPQTSPAVCVVCSRLRRSHGPRRFAPRGSASPALLAHRQSTLCRALGRSAPDDLARVSRARHRTECGSIGLLYRIFNRAHCVTLLSFWRRAAQIHPHPVRCKRAKIPRMVVHHRVVRDSLPLRRHSFRVSARETADTPTRC